MTFDLSPSIETLATLPYLRRVKIKGCAISVHSLLRFNKLTHLSLDSCMGDNDMFDVLRTQEF
jgi:hypothetical protein